MAKSETKAKAKSKAKAPPRKALSPAHYEAIGHVIVSCSALQHILAIGAFSLAVNDREPWKHDIGVGVLTTGMSAQTLIGVWRTLARIRAPDDADSFDKLADQIQTTFSHRDLFAHCMWRPGRKSGTAISELAKTVGSLRKTQTHALTAAQINSWAERASEQTLNLLGFLVRWGVSPPPS